MVYIPCATFSKLILFRSFYRTVVEDTGSVRKVAHGGLHVILEFFGAEAGGQDIRVVLGGGEGVLHEGYAVGSGLEGALPLLGRQVD